MSKDIQKLEIYFKDVAATFKAGDTVSGTVQLETNQELKVKGVKLLLLGAARVHWDEKRAYTKGSSSKLSHKNIDAYLDETYIIIGRSDTITPGRHSWPFSVRLPLYLPASYDGQWGRVHYLAKVAIERQWKGDIEYSRNFTIIGLLDLNNDSDARKPVENVSEAMVGLGCCKSGPVMGHLALSRRGFAVGQSIPFHARIENRARKKVTVRMVLSQQATFKADRQTRKNSTVVKVLTKGEVRSGESIVWDDELKAIPTLPPTKLGGGCRTIDIKYLLTLVIIPSGTGGEVETPVEVTIGSVALRSSDRRPSFNSQSGDIETARHTAQELFKQTAQQKPAA